MAVCYYHVTYEFQSESTLYSLPECEGTPCSLLLSNYCQFKNKRICYMLTCYHKDCYVIISAWC